MKHLPCNLEAEEQLLGAAMRDPDCVAAAAIPIAALYHPLHQEAWGAILRLCDRSEPCDPITIADEAHGLNDPGRGELRQLLTKLLVGCYGVPDIVTHYAEAIRKAWVTRQTLLACSGVQSRIAEGEGGVELVTELLGSLSAIETEQAATALSVSELVVQRGREIYEAITGSGVQGYRTGIDGLDRILGGLQPGIVTIAAARPGMGKSALAMTVTRANAEAGAGVHVFSLEDTRAAYTDRMLARYSGLPAEDMRCSGLSLDKWTRLKSTLTRLKNSGMPWIVDDRSGIDATEIVRSVRKHRRVNETQVVIVDYVQLLKRPKGESMHEHMGNSITVLADAAKRDGMAYLVLSQLNRGLESRDDKVPRLSDLRESGSLEERSKCVIGLYRPAVYDQSAKDSEIQLHVLKNSQGRTGYVEAIWDGPTTTIR